MTELRLTWGEVPVGVWTLDRDILASLVHVVSDRHVLAAAIVEYDRAGSNPPGLLIGFALGDQETAPSIDLAAPIVARIRHRHSGRRGDALLRLWIDGATIARKPEGYTIEGRAALIPTWPWRLGRWSLDGSSGHGHLDLENRSGRGHFDGPWGCGDFDFENRSGRGHFDGPWGCGRFDFQDRAGRGHFELAGNAMSVDAIWYHGLLRVRGTDGPHDLTAERRKTRWNQVLASLLNATSAALPKEFHQVEDRVFERLEHEEFAEIHEPRPTVAVGGVTRVGIIKRLDSDLEDSSPYGQPQAQNPYGQPQAQNPYGQPQAQNPYGQQPQAQNPYSQPQAPHDAPVPHSGPAPHDVPTPRDAVPAARDQPARHDQPAPRERPATRDLPGLGDAPVSRDLPFRRDVPAAHGPNKTVVLAASDGIPSSQMSAPARRRSPLSLALSVPIAAVTAPIVGMLGLVRGARSLVAERAERRLLEEPEAVSAAVQRAAPPCATAYRPSWVLPRRQSSIHVYVVVPEAQAHADREAHAALDAASNPAQKAHPIPLWRTPEAGEPLAVSVDLTDFDVGRVEPIAWRPPYVRFIVPICAHAGIALGVHRPRVTVRSAGTSREALATFDFDLEVRAQTPRASRLRTVLVGGCATAALAAWAATVQHSLPPAIGWPAGAVCLAGGVRGAWPAPNTMVPAETRDRTTVFAAFAPEDRDQVKRAIRLLQAQNAFPAIDADALLDDPPPLERLARAERCFVFWSAHARASSDVARACAAAAARAAATGDAGRFVTPVLLDHDRPDADHPLARFEPTDLAVVADVLIVTAVKDEYLAVLGVDTGAVPGTAWTPRTGPNRLDVAFRDFAVAGGGVLRIAVTQALGMGGVNAVDAAARLIDAYAVRCLAMCGVCAGRRGDVELGDVIIADRLWQYDTGKRKVAIDAQGHATVREQADIDMYKIQPPEWLQAAERFAPPPDAPWLAARPRPHAAQADWILERVFHQADPAADPDQPVRCADYDKAVARLWKAGLLRGGTLELTDAGRAHITRQLTQHRNRLPDPTPLKLHLGPIASGNQVMEDAEIFPLLADSVRKVIGVEMEAAAIGTLAHTAQLRYSVVMKAVMDHADPDKSDNFKPFAARASAECLIGFLRTNLPPRTPPIP